MESSIAGYRRRAAFLAGPPRRIMVIPAALAMLGLAISGVPPAAAATVASSRRTADRPGRPDDRVLVIMRDQPAAARPGTSAGSARTASIALAQAPLLRQLRQTRATHVTSYRLVDALSATVSKTEAAELRTDPEVAEVLPDQLIQGPMRPAAAARRPEATGARPARAPGLSPHIIPGACPASGQVQLDPEGLETTNTASANPAAKTARSLGITGAGIKVAFLADGLDPHNVNFIRPDGKSVFSQSAGGDYRDFSGDGPGQVTGGAEAFIDANAIAGQGIHVYNVSHFSDQSDPSACDLRIEGVAPGASLVGLDVYGSYEYTLESNFLEAIDYAVETDHVNVLNESFSSNPFPDVPALSVVDLFNNAAVAAGTTVTVSAGDGGTANTIGSPASDPNVISVGASTTFRFYAQTNYAAARYFATSGWLNDNVSALSSAGFTESGGTVDLVAPGDLGFASCSTDIAVYEDCLNLNNVPSPVETSGGTSESAPMTAGAAALVIQAYRQTHGGANPAPALVRQILTSTATDLGLPASEQGAGLLNSYKAVLLAESVKTSAGAPAPAGNTLLLSRSQLSATGPAGTARTWQLRVTNTGSSAQQVRALGSAFGPDRDIQTGTVRLSDGTSPQFTDFQGLPNNYAEFHFTVKPGANRLVASIAYPGFPGTYPYSQVWLTLVDPRGRLAADSIPQGIGNYGSVDVRAPAAGTWTGIVFGITAYELGTNGKIPWRVATQRFTSFGQVSPGRFLLQPGQSQAVRVTEQLPAQPGDTSGLVVLRSDKGGDDANVGREFQSVPVTLRTLVSLAGGGTFSGVLTGGNGRPPGVGQVDYYEFRVGRGQRDIRASVSLTGDPADVVGSYLIAPDGEALGFGQNSLSGATGGGESSLTAYTLNPAPGDWTLVVEFTSPNVGDAVSVPFHGAITLNAGRATATGLPDSTRVRLRPKAARTVLVRVTNTGAAPEQFFADARLSGYERVRLAQQDGSDIFQLPLSGSQPEWLVPTQTTGVAATAAASLPIEFDWGPAQGDPDLFAPPAAKDRAAGSFSVTTGTVQPGYWVAGPDELGPYDTFAPAGEVTMLMSAETRAFNRSMTTSTGDLWLTSLNPVAPFDPVTIGPGRSGLIKVVIRPAGQPGTVVRGYLYVDDYLASVPPYDQSTGDELVAIPYAYTIG
jgi:hypothetical protein